MIRSTENGQVGNRLTAWSDVPSYKSNAPFSTLSDISGCGEENNSRNDQFGAPSCSKYPRHLAWDSSARAHKVASLHIPFYQNELGSDQNVRPDEFDVDIAVGAVESGSELQGSEKSGPDDDGDDGISYSPLTSQYSQRIETNPNCQQGIEHVAVWNEQNLQQYGDVTQDDQRQTHLQRHTQYLQEHHQLKPLPQSRQALPQGGTEDAHPRQMTSLQRTQDVRNGCKSEVQDLTRKQNMLPRKGLEKVYQKGNPVDQFAPYYKEREPFAFTEVETKDVKSLIEPVNRSVASNGGKGYGAARLAETVPNVESEEPAILQTQTIETNIGYATRQHEGVRKKSVCFNLNSSVSSNKVSKMFFNISISYRVPINEYVLIN